MAGEAKGAKRFQAADSSSQGVEQEPDGIHLLIYDQRGERKATKFHLIFRGALDPQPLFPSKVYSHTLLQAC